VSIAVACLAIGACTRETPSVVDAKGAVERHVTVLWWPLLWVGTAVFVFVLAMLVVGIARGRRRTEEDARRDARWGEPFIVVGAVGVTGVILAGFFLFSLIQMRAIASGEHNAALTIRVTGHDWWWEAAYPGGAVTANEIHIPTGERVRLLLDGGDVIHSFWVPQLAPKRDTIPGKTNVLTLEADAPGRFRGQCAEYCGLQHAHMGLWVYAQKPDDFAKWMSDQGRPLAAPTGEAARGMRVFMTSTCVGCHAIRGTPATGRAGPDLTHLASRDTIAGAFLSNTAGELSDWITDPQDEKPGAVMPPTQLSASDLSALVAFLRSLK
jgi:cytochrome c oxidase subunit 2